MAPRKSKRARTEVGSSSRQTRSSFQSGAITDQRFRTPEYEEHYRTVNNKEFMKERAFVVVDKGYSEFTDVIKARNWNKLCMPVGDACETLVKEFYTHAKVLDKRKGSSITYKSWFR